MSRCLLLLFPLLASCTSSVPESTVQMAAELEMIAHETDQDPFRNAHANRARAAELKTYPLPADLSDRIQYEATLGTELLRAGESGEASEIFQGNSGYSTNASRDVRFLMASGCDGPSGTQLSPNRGAGKLPGQPYGCQMPVSH